MNLNTEDLQHDADHVKAWSYFANEKKTNKQKTKTVSSSLESW